MFVNQNMYLQRDSIYIFKGTFTKFFFSLLERLDNLGLVGFQNFVEVQVLVNWSTSDAAQQFRHLLMNG